MTKLSAFRVGLYRGISGLELDDLAPFNLFTGPNGIGKTSVIEAMWLFGGRFNAATLWQPNIQRSVRAVTDPILRVGKREIRLSGTEADGKHTWRATFEPIIEVATATPETRNGETQGVHSLSEPSPGRLAGFLRVWFDEEENKATPGRFVTTPDGLVPVPVLERVHSPGVFVTAEQAFAVSEETIKDFSKIVIAGKKDQLRRDLRIILPLVEDVEVVTVGSGNAFILASTTEGERLPLQALGGGMMHLFHILIGLREASGGMIFLDEVEHGLHHSILEDYWRRIRRVAVELDVQVFATTHSLECVDAAVSAFEESADDLAVHSLRLGKDDGHIRVATFRGESLQGAREINLELR